MTKTKALAIFLSLVVCFVVVAPLAMAQIQIEENLRNTGAGIYGQGNQPEQQLPEMIGNIINVVLGLLGIVMVIYVILGGWKYMSSGGSDEGAKKGKTMLLNAVIGLAIILAAYSISSFVISRLITATGTST
jgi:hypothetical protein